MREFRESGSVGALGEQSPGATRSSPAKLPRHVQRADALGLLAESFIANGAATLNGGDRHQIIVHIAAETLRDNAAGRCEIEHGPSLAAETARRLACDASVVPLIENAEGDPLNVGRKRRTTPPALRRALNARDRGCRFPGCGNSRVDAHHVVHWAHGGETKLSNTVLLCKWHHRQVHEGRVIVEALDDGAFRFVKPNGQCFDSIAPGPLTDWMQLPTMNQQHDLHIDRRTGAGRWRGERMDYGLAIEVLLNQARRARERRASGK